MQSVIRLERYFDVNRLLHDLAIAERAGHEHAHHGPYHDGGWSAIPLFSMGGKVDEAALKWAGPKAKSGFSKTPILEACSYFSEILDGFQCEKQRVRLMRLAPGRMWTLFPST